MGLVSCLILTERGDPMSYLHTFQWKFGHIKYPSGSNPKATVSTSGCGPCSALMILENMTDIRYNMQDWINWVISTGARVNGGTDMKVLSNAMAKKFGFTVSTTSDENVLKNHLKQGGMAIGNCGGSYSGWRGLFSTAGHFFTIIGITDDDYFIVLDPNWTQNKFTNAGNSLSKWRRQHVIQGNGTHVYVNADNLNRDTKTRTPSYYLFSLPGSGGGKDEEEVTQEEFNTMYAKVNPTYKNLEDVPVWYRDAAKYYIDAGQLKGDGTGNVNKTLEQLQVLTIVCPKVCDTVEECPEYARETIQKLIDQGALKGVDNGKLGLTLEMIRLLCINDKITK